MSDELRELRRRLMADVIGAQRTGDEHLADGIKTAIYELDNLSKPYTGDENNG